MPKEACWEGQPLACTSPFTFILGHITTLLSVFIFMYFPSNVMCPIFDNWIKDQLPGFQNWQSFVLFPYVFEWDRRQKTSVGEQHVPNTAHNTKTGYTHEGQGQRGQPWASRPMGLAEPKKGPSQPCIFLAFSLYLSFYVPMKILHKNSINKN